MEGWLTERSGPLSYLLPLQRAYGRAYFNPMVRAALNEFPRNAGELNMFPQKDRLTGKGLAGCGTRDARCYNSQNGMKTIFTISLSAPNFTKTVNFLKLSYLSKFFIKFAVLVEPFQPQIWP